MSSTHGVIGFGSGPPGKIFSYQKIYLCKFPVGLTTRREVQAMGESGDRGDVDDRGRARLGSGDRGDVDDRGRARALPAQVSFQKTIRNDLNLRYKCSSAYVARLSGQARPEKYFPTRKFICENFRWV